MKHAMMMEVVFVKLGIGKINAPLVKIYIPLIKMMVNFSNVKDIV